MSTAFNIISVSSGLALEVNKSSKSAGAEITQALHDPGNLAQSWHLVRFAGQAYQNQYFIRSALSGLVLASPVSAGGITQELPTIANTEEELSPTFLMQWWPEWYPFGEIHPVGYTIQTGGEYTLESPGSAPAQIQVTRNVTGVESEQWRFKPLMLPFSAKGAQYEPVVYITGLQNDPGSYGTGGMVLIYGSGFVPGDKLCVSYVGVPYFPGPTDPSYIIRQSGVYQMSYFSHKGTFNKQVVTVTQAGTFTLNDSVPWVTPEIYTPMVVVLVEKIIDATIPLRVGIFLLDRELVAIGLTSPMPFLRG